MKRPGPLVALATAVSAGVFLMAAPVLAAPTNVTWPSAIVVKAGPAEENEVRIIYGFLSPEGIGYSPTDDGFWTHVVFDLGAGITTVEHTDRPSCFLPSLENQLPEKSVHCPDGTSVAPYPGGGEDFVVTLGDRNDLFDVRNQSYPGGNYDIGSLGEFEVHAGPGNDKVYGNQNYAEVFATSEEEPGFRYWTQDDLNGDQGNDLLVGSEGADLLSGGSGADTLNGGFEAIEDEFYTGEDDVLLGGPGNDLLKAWHADRDQVINCGPGKRDKAIIDRGLDPRPKGCERIKKKPPAGAID